MTEHSLAADRTPTPTTLAEISGPFFKRRLLAQLTRLRRGHLRLVDGNERYDFGNVGRDEGLRATVRVNNVVVYRQMALLAVIRDKGTESAFTGAYNDFRQRHLFVSIVRFGFISSDDKISFRMWLA